MFPVDPSSPPPGPGLAFLAEAFEGAIGPLTDITYINTPHGDERGRPGKWRPDILFSNTTLGTGSGGVLNDTVTGKPRFVAGVHGLKAGDEEWVI